VVRVLAGRPFEAVAPAGTFARADLEGAFTWLPGFRGARPLRRAFVGGEHVAYRLSTGASRSGALFDGEAVTFLAGYAAQGAAREQALRGAVVVGIPLGYRYRAASLLGVRELLASTRFPGVGLDAHVEGAGWWLDLAGEAAFHFSGLAAPKATGWRPLEPGQVGKSIFRREGYFYGLGPELELRANVAVGTARFDGSVGWLGARSVDGLDRAQEGLTVDEAIAVRRLEAKAHVGVALPESPWSAFVGGELVRWNSRVQEEVAELHSLAVTAGAGFRY
jgi:hypothetical protein